MRLPVLSGLLSLSTALTFALSPTVQQCGGDDDDYSSRLLVGVATTTILPEVNGSTAYFDALRESPLALEPGDPGENPGVFVEEWDVGTIAIGNGFPSSHWVHDEIRAGAVAFKDLDQPDGKTLVLVSADVYMLFRQDIQVAFDKARLRLGDTEYNKLSIVVSATHNHMGPDTSGLDGINDQYYEYLTDQLASVIVAAVDPDTMTPAKLKVATSKHQFGLSDGDAPFIADPTLNSLQAISTDDGHILFTLAQWQNHPEDTLSFGRDVFASDTEAEYLKSVGECFSDDDVNCYIEGQYISAGFPGYAVRHIQEATGAPALYFNGPVGSMITPLDATIWETEGESGKPVGNGVDIPDGAVIIEKNFHKLAVNGNELGKRILSDLAEGTEYTDLPVRIYREEFYTRLSNWGFRVGLTVRNNGQPLALGYKKRELYNCPVDGPKTAETCVADGYVSEADPLMNLPTRVGDHVKAEVFYLKIGPIGMITIPGESVVELVEGLPSDFMDDPRNTYHYDDRHKANHAVGAAYDTNGYVRQAMNDTYKWALGLTMDEMGYFVPISDWRIFCVADTEELGGVSGKCAELKAAGIMEFKDYSDEDYSISGARCKSIIETPEVLNGEPYTLVEGGAEWAYNTCYYGQTFDEAEEHYVQTMAAGWDMASDWTETVKKVTGWSGELEDVNPEFVGYNQLPK